MLRWVILLQVVVGLVAVPFIARTQVFTVKTAMPDMRLCQGTSSCMPVSFDYRASPHAITEHVAQLNVDGRWSVRPWGLLCMAWHYPPWTYGSGNVWWLLLALPVLPTESFIDGDKANSNPQYIGEDI